MSLAALRMLKCRLCSQPQAGPEGLCRDCARALTRARQGSAALKGAAAGSARKQRVVERIVLTSPNDGENTRTPVRGRAVLWAVTGMVALVLILVATAGRSPQRAVEPKATAHAARVVPPLLEPTTENSQLDAALAGAEPLPALQPGTPAVVDPLSPPKEAPKTPAMRPARVAANASASSRASTDAKSGGNLSRANGATTPTPEVEPPVQQARVSVTPSTSSSDEQSLASALEKCSNEKFLAGVICEQKARLRYCEGKWGQVPQCTAKPRVD